MVHQILTSLVENLSIKKEFSQQTLLAVPEFMVLTSGEAAFRLQDEGSIYFLSLDYLPVFLWYLNSGQLSMSMKLFKILCINSLPVLTIQFYRHYAYMRLLGSLLQMGSAIQLG